VLDAHPEARRTIENVAGFSGPPYEFLAAARSSRVWGAATAPLREGLDAVAEMTLFPGLAIFGLALAGWRIGTLPARLRRGLAIGVLAFALLSLGFQLNGLSWLYPYRWLYEFLPGWQGIRVPGRLHTLTTLCLALLAGAGAAALAARARARWGARPATAGLALACLAILAEGGASPIIQRSRSPRPVTATRRSPPFTCPPARSTTVATCCGRPTASRTSSTGAGASSRASSRRRCA